MEILLAPSILSANFYNLEHDINLLKKNNIKILHLDVMDGNFVPNISFGIPVIKKIKEFNNENFIFDTHLMIVKPDRYIKEFKEAGADILTVHKEATENLDLVIDSIKKENLNVGVSINPLTDVSCLEPVLDKIDLALVMSVEPGFGGQKFIPNALDKIKFLYKYKEKHNLSYDIEVDGGINKDNICSVVEAGANIIVAGSAIFNNDIDNNILELERKIK